MARKQLGSNTSGSTDAVTVAGSQTLTNKTVQTRVTTITSSATPAINTNSCDVVTITALATPITSMSSSTDSPAGSLTGTPFDGQKLIIRIKDNGTAQTITWGPKFASTGISTLLVTTVISKTHYIGFLWNASTTTWDCVAVDALGR